MESVYDLLWLVPVNTVSCVVPLGVASLENEVEPPNARSRLPPDDTAVNVDAVTPLPHVSWPLETPQEPLEVFIVKLLAVPVKVYVASVCVDQVPPVSRPPVVLAVIVPLEGRVPELCVTMREKNAGWRGTLEISHPGGGAAALRVLSDAAGK